MRRNRITASGSFEISWGLSWVQRSYILPLFSSTSFCMEQGWVGKFIRFTIYYTCRRPTRFSTTYFFQFGDVIAELSTPLLGMAAFGNVVLQYIFALQIALVWYSVGDHSENLKLGHYWHHYYINSNYTVCTSIRPFRKKLKKDFVQERVFDIKTNFTSDAEP
jgi:hypothetical protein